MSPVLAEAKGVGGRITFDGQQVHFTDKNGQISHSVPVQQIHEVIRFPPRALGGIGALQFLTVGGRIPNANKASLLNNSLGFKPADYKDASDLADMVQATIGRVVPMLAVIGTNGSATFDGDVLQIRRPDGWPTPGSVGGSKRLLVKTVAAVELSPASARRDGYLQLTVPGGIERKPFVFRRSDAFSDENSITFTKEHETSFVELRNAIESAISSAASTSQSPAPQKSNAEQLRDLWELHLAGAITREEFELEKKILLSGEG